MNSSSSSSSMDVYHSTVLTQLTDIQARISKLTSYMRDEGKFTTGNVQEMLQTSVPLRSYYDDSQTRMHTKYSKNSPPNNHTYSKKPFSSSGASGGTYKSSSDRPVRTVPYPSMKLSDVLHENEFVTMRVHTGKNDEGSVVDATLVVKFDGKDELVVTECDKVNSLVGMKSSKPGEILYKFIEKLKDDGVIQKVFKPTPWKLCFVTRNGSVYNLEQLRLQVNHN